MRNWSATWACASSIDRHITRELTEAGRRFEQRAFDAVRAFESALVSVDGHEVPLRIGHSWSAGTYLSAIVRAWNSQPRPCALVVSRHEDRSAGLSSGKVDVALTRGPIDGARFRSVVLDEEARVAVLHVGSPLSRRRRLTLADLSDGTLVPTQVGTTSRALWPAGHQPAVGAEVGTVDDWLVAIASGAGFGVSVSSTAALHRHPDVRYVPLVDAPPVPLLLAWPRRGATPRSRSWCSSPKRACVDAPASHRSHTRSTEFTWAKSLAAKSSAPGSQNQVPSPSRYLK